MHKGLRHKSAVGKLQAVKTEAEKAWGLEVSSLLFAFSAKLKRELDFLPEGRWGTEMDFLNTEGRARKGPSEAQKRPAMEHTKLQENVVTMTKRAEHPSALLSL